MRPEWLATVVRECQVLAGSVLDREPSAIRAHAREFAQRLPDPCGPVEVILLRYFLYTAIQQIWRTSRRPKPGTTDWSDMWLRAQSGESLKESFIRAVDAHTRSEMRQAGQEASLADRIVELLDGTYADPWTVKTVAARLNHHPRTVERVCRASFGKGFHMYLREVRVRAAIRLLMESDTKIEAIGLLVGFRSRSGFHNAIVGATGCSPASLRAKATATHP